MTIYYGGGVVGFQYDATVKPRMDTEEILSKDYKFAEISSFDDLANEEDAVRQSKIFKEDDTFVIQWPTYSPLSYERKLFGLLKDKNVNIIALVHDVDYIRFGGRSINLIKILNMFDFLILPSANMRCQLLKDGLDENTPFLYQQTWDFLSNSENKINISEDSNIFYTGNLNEEKIQFMEDLKTDLIVYGDTNRDIYLLNSHIIFKGRGTQDEITKNIECGIGLVWASGKYGEYEQYNLPFKMAQYLAANIPIICKEGTPVADFVRKMGVGVAISNIEQLDEAKKYLMENKEMTEYALSVVGTVIRGGYFIRKNVMNAILNLIGGKTCENQK